MDKYCANSIILIDKPVNFTSFDIIKQLRKRIGIKKIGHSGVLDKPASGLLVCASGRATKLLSLFENGYKIYRADILFGLKTDTYDLTGKIVDKKNDITVNISDLEAVLDEFKGEIIQEVPPYSNVKVNGKRMYKYSLNGRQVKPPSRKVVIYEIKAEKVEHNAASLVVKCSKGTYIRSLANDIGNRLGIYGCIKSLRRTFSYPFSLDDAHNVEELRCMSPNNALSFLPSIKIKEELISKVANGVYFGNLYDIDKLKPGLYRVLAGDCFVSLIEKKENRVIYRFILPND